MMRLTDSRDFLANPMDSSINRRSSRDPLFGNRSGASCWSRRTGLEKLLTVAFVCSFISIIGFIIGVAVLHNDIDRLKKDLVAAQGELDDQPTLLPSGKPSTPSTVPSTLSTTHATPGGSGSTHGKTESSATTEQSSNSTTEETISSTNPSGAPTTVHTTVASTEPSSTVSSTETTGTTMNESNVTEDASATTVTEDFQSMNDGIPTTMNNTSS